MSDHAATPTGRVQCPRCGYDQRGVVQTWTEKCPLDGTCSECGLDWQWRDVLNPQFSYPSWCVEYGIGFRTTVIRSILSLRQMFRPARFWSQLRMEHQPRWLRIIVLQVSAFALLHFVCIALVLGWAVGRFTANDRAWGGTTDSPVLAGVRAMIYPRPGYGSFPGHLTERWTELQTYQVFPLSVDRMQRIRREHLFMPRRSVSGALAATAGFWTFAVVLLTPLGMVVLPISRRVARVRWGHIVRIWMYSLLILLIPASADAASYLYLWRHDERWMFGSSFVASILLTFIWWRAAVKHYLRMPHASAVSAAIIVVSYLSSLAVFGVLDLALDLIWLWSADP